jgi:ribosomal-protein-alanine N-acetyltransferase
MLDPQATYTIRPMVEDDMALVLAIEAQAQSHPWNATHFMSSLRSSHQCYVVVTQQTNEPAIVAYAITSTAADEAELLTIAVAPTHQHQGIGRWLLHSLCDSFNHTIHTFFLEVRASNKKAITLYDSLAFNEVGRRPNYYPCHHGGREDAIIMAKSLCL